MLLTPTGLIQLLPGGFMNQLYHFHFLGKCIVHLSITIFCEVLVMTGNMEFLYIMRLLYVSESCQLMYSCLRVKNMLLVSGSISSPFPQWDVAGAHGYLPWCLASHEAKQRRWLPHSQLYFVRLWSLLTWISQFLPP